jgi:uncharacterized membrane protein YoaK (UPF0700 family)
VATHTDRSNGTGVAVLAVLLAACAGSVDVFAFSRLLQLPRAALPLLLGEMAILVALLLAGATISGVVLFNLGSAAPGVPVVLLAVAIAVHLLTVRRPLNASDRA